MVEENVRNLAAHEIVAINDEKIVKLTGFTGEQIMQLFKRVFAYSVINVRQEEWESYEKMNQMILDLLERT